MLIEEREEQLLRRKFKEKHRDSRKGREEGEDEGQHQQDRKGKALESL